MSSRAHTISTHTLQAGENLHAGGIAATLARWWNAYWHRRAQRATVLMLEALDDKTLRDIGLGRSEIQSVVYEQACERRLRYQPHWA